MCSGRARDSACSSRRLHFLETKWGCFKLSVRQERLSSHLQPLHIFSACGCDVGSIGFVSSDQDLPRPGRRMIQSPPRTYRRRYRCQGAAAAATRHRRRCRPLLRCGLSRAADGSCRKVAGATVFQPEAIAPPSGRSVAGKLVQMWQAVCATPLRRAAVRQPQGIKRPNDARDTINPVPADADQTSP